MTGSSCDQKLFNYKHFDTIESAKEHCSDDVRCGGLLDYGCSDKGIYLCEIGTIEDTTEEDCVHKKTGFHISLTLSSVRNQIGAWFNGKVLIFCYFYCSKRRSRMC